MLINDIHIRCYGVETGSWNWNGLFVVGHIGQDRLRNINVLELAAVLFGMTVTMAIVVCCGCLTNVSV